MPKDDTKLLDWIREDLKEDIEHIRSSVDRFSEKLDKHETKCPARKAFFAKPSFIPSRGSPVPPWLIKIGPLVLAAAIGLLGIGAYLGGSQDVTKMQKQLVALQAAIEKAN